MCLKKLKQVKSKAVISFWLVFSFVCFFAGALFAEEGVSEKPSFDKAYSFKDGGLQLYKSEDENKRLTLGGEIIARVAYWDWFKAPLDNNEYQYGFQRTRINMRFASNHMNVFVQPQYVHMFDLPDDAVSPPPAGPLGMGGLYYLHNKEKDPYNIGIHQAYVRFHDLFDNNITLKIGRFEYSDGLEAVRKEDGKKFTVLKKMCLADRLISSFGWSAFARSFDGGLFSYVNDAVTFTTSFFYPTQGGWEKDINRTIEDIEITTATLTSKRGAVFPKTEMAVFFYNYEDSRAVTQRVDNSGSTISADGVDIAIQMIGGHVLGVYDVGPGQLDVLLWGGLQFGDWYELDQQAYAVDGEVGYQFKEVPWKPWLRMGFFVSSGDDDPADNEHGTFFQMAPGTRKYNLFAFL
ncbi:MAG: alginate export family protein [Candidatus Theseobacter exili]|nr:alginate export family protein [Candidatus Theseobacter exili]